MFAQVVALLVVCGGLLKSLISNEWNTASILITALVAAVMIALYTVKSKAKESVTYIAAAAAFEVLVYELHIPFNFLATTIILAISAYTNPHKVEGDTVKLPAVMYPWLFARFIMMTFATDAAYESSWRLAQVLLFFTVLFQLRSGNQKSRSAVTAVLVSVWLLYSGNDVVPHDIPIVCIVLPIVYVARVAADSSDKANTGSSQAVLFGVIMTITLCYLWPHHELVVGDDSGPCADVPNTEPCVSGMPLTYVTPSCCCKSGFMKMPKKNACVIDSCQSKLNRAPSQDCCGIKRMPNTEALLYGIYQCRCNNDPVRMQHGYDATANTCLCQAPYTGAYCEYTTSTEL